MKKLFTLLFVLLTAFTFKTSAQLLSCNADFTFSNVSGYTYQFNPVLVGDSFNTHHFWTFGDGSPFATAPAPQHTYGSPGVYTVTHVQKRNNPNGVQVCADTVFKTVLVQSFCNLQAGFYPSPFTTSPLARKYIQTTTPFDPNDSIRWTFGDGTPALIGKQGDSSITNPVHTYNAPGVYQVCLRVKKNNAAGTAPCVSEICRLDTVQSTSVCNLQANYTWFADSLFSQIVHFNNTTIGLSNTDSIRWTFGDGTSSNVINPVHTYAQAGAYTVCLRVQKRNNNGGLTNCISEKCYVVQVASACTLQANFNWNVDSSNSQKIYFHNTSAPMNLSDSVSWKFGDGTSLSGVQGGGFSVANPTHIYANPGTYTVCLRIKKNNTVAGTACIREICKTIVVQPACTFMPSYTWKLDSANRKKVIFTNTTSSPTSGAIAQWSFGDGTSATSWNAVHEYAQPGRYLVCLTVKISNTCQKTTCDTVVVPVPMPPCTDISKYTYIKAATSSQMYTFKADYISNDIDYVWTFGDGTGGRGPISNHFFLPGTYTVCLTAWKNANCASTTCKTITVTPQFNCNAVQVSYTYQKDPFMPNKVYFYAVANYPILDQLWTIRKVSPDSNFAVTLHQNNPIYTFADTGVYKVCLRAVTLGGCIKEYCNYIHIDRKAPQCVLQAYPNPATTQVNVNVQLSAPQMIDVYIYNTQNILVREKHQQGNSGSNVVTISVADLPAGQYTMKVIHGNDVCYSKFQKI